MRFNALVLWLTLGAILASGSVGAGLVLCVGPDDHLAFELKEAESECAGCPGDGAPASTEPVRSSMAASECPCVDVTLDSGTLIAKPESGQRWVIPDPCAASVPFVAPAPVVSERARRARWTPPPPSALLAEMRTVVLLV